MPFLFIIVLSVYLLGNTYIFVKGLHALAHFSLLVRGIYSTLFWLCAVLLVVIMLLRNSKTLSFGTGHILFEIGSGWLVFTLYMVMFLAATDLVRLFNHSFTLGFPIALILTVSILIYGYINYQHPNKQVINIVINKPLAGADHLKIVAISDLHLGYGTDKTLLHKQINLLNAENPDLIIIGGDLIDNSINPVAKEAMEQELNRLKAKTGIFMSPGNHEYISGINSCEEYITNKTKITFLRDSVITLPCGLQILGRDDRSNRHRLDAEQLQLKTDPNKPLLIIDHQPVNITEAQQIGADIQFSGHTHYGQVFPLNLLTNKLFEISYGYEKRGDTHYYVSSGFGLWGPPFRIGTDCEYVVFEINFLPESKK